MSQQSLVFDLGEVEVADGTRVHVEAYVTLTIMLNGLPVSRHGLFGEYHLRDALRLLLARLGDPLAWRDALGDGDADREDEDE